MRTTLTIDDDVATALKVLARNSGKTLKAVVNEDSPFHSSDFPSGTTLSVYLFSIRRPDRYLWITLDSSV